MTGENSRAAFYSERLQKMALFRDVSPSSIHDLLAIANPKTWDKKGRILDSNDTLTSFYIILEGRLKAYHYRPDLNRQLTLFLLTGGDVFDICTMMKGNCREVFYEALDDTELLCLPIHLLKDWMRKNKSFYFNLLEYTIAKMSRLENYLSELIMEDTCKRLALLLYHHMDPASREVEVLNGLSHAELAALIGTTRTVVGRHLTNFKEAGILRTSQKEIRIINVKSLQELIS